MIEPIVHAGFSLLASTAIDHIKVTFTGNGDMEAVSVLRDFLAKVHALAAKQAAGKVIFDFQDLYFMNSSCFKCFVFWINVVAKGEATPVYEIRFLTNPKLRWQARSLEALRAFAPSIVKVDARVSSP